MRIRLIAGGLNTARGFGPNGRWSSAGAGRGCDHWDARPRRFRVQPRVGRGIRPRLTRASGRVERFRPRATAPSSRPANNAFRPSGWSAARDCRHYCRSSRPSTAGGGAGPEAGDTPGLSAGAGRGCTVSPAVRRRPRRQLRVCLLSGPGAADIGLDGVGFRGPARTIWKFRRRDVRGIVRHEIGAPRPGAVQHGPVAMASEIGTLRYPDGLRRTIHRDELRVHVTSEHVGNFEIDRLQAVHGDPWIGQAPANPRAGGNDEHEFDDHRGIRHRDHVGFTARSGLPAGCRRAEG